MIRLIATDMDRTLLRSDHTISARTLAAFEAARQAGVEVVAISGRQPYSIASLVMGTALEGVVVGANGAVAMDIRTQQVLFEETLAVASQQELAAAMVAAYPGLKAVSVRKAGNLYVTEDGYTGNKVPGAEASPWEIEFRPAPLAEVLAEPSVKLVLEHPAISAEQLLATAVQLNIPGCHPTTSGAPFLEVSRAGINKGTALTRICQQRDIPLSDVVAFGDNLNDIEMLQAAGHGVAMGNALPETQRVADEITATNDEDGVALVIERLLAS